MSNSFMAGKIIDEYAKRIPMKGKGANVPEDDDDVVDEKSASEMLKARQMGYDPLRPNGMTPGQFIASKVKKKKK